MRGRRVRLVRPAKPMYPAVGFTKRDVVDYDLAVAPALLPHHGDDAGLRFGPAQVLSRLEREGDLFAPVLGPGRPLPDSSRPNAPRPAVGEEGD